ncbi:MAG TPA: hypothetical protein VLF87_02910 [Patescibacteria group bacterium]|nr:hypothetical protein [Patescibacteria group bacterium]
MRLVKKYRNTKMDQNGMAAIIIALFLIIIVALIVIGFVALTNRQQRQALDRELNTAAYYAAESGVNDAVRILKNPAYANNLGGLKKTNCDNSSPPYNTDLHPNLDSISSYTCVLVTTAVPDIQFNPVSTTDSSVFTLQKENGNPVNKIRIEWTDPSGAGDISSCQPSDFPPAPTAGCNLGFLRVDLVPTSGPVDRDSLINNTATYFLHPKLGGASTPSYSPGFGSQGEIDQASCSNGPADCVIVIDNLLATSYQVRIKSIYNATNVKICAGVCGINLVGAQAMVDATGKANDVLRRIQVRVPLSSNSADIIPEFAIQSGDTLCKRLAVAAPNTVQTDQAHFNECKVQ